LLLLRHAKSSWNNAHLGDHERPLAPRGQRAAAALAAHVAGFDPPPDLVLCSTARRAQETLAPVAAVLPDDTEILVEDPLYGASAPELVERLRAVAEDTASVLLVGHNPGLEELVRALGRDGDAGAIARVGEKFPTGALATLTFEGPWAKLGSAPATLEAFVIPGDLE
jgi:phosphohistidine phosphatase